MRQKQFVTTPLNDPHKLAISKAKDLNEDQKIVTRTSRKNIRWNKMTLGQVIACLRGIIDQHQIKTREELLKKASGAYKAAKKRGLFDEVGLPKKTGSERSWIGISDADLVKMAQAKIDAEQLVSISKLRYIDHGMYTELWERKLLGKLNIENSSKTAVKWSKMPKKELLRIALDEIRERGYKTRTEFQIGHGSLYNALTRMKLIPKLNLPSKIEHHRNWRKYSDKQLVKVANQRIVELKARTKTDFLKKDNGLCDAIIKRELIDKLVFYKTTSDQ